tara:strand:+ start:999 stop:1766 length:768 start_codon:yes stop_codon:yes gene_type:complete
MFINNFDPVAFQVFSFEIRWYSLAYIFGIIFGWTYCNKFIIKDQILKRQFDNYITYLIIGIIFGGRLGYVLFYNPIYFLNHPFEIFMIWNGGMSFHGALIGVVLTALIFCKKNNQDFFYFADLVAISSPIGIFFGRIANFINGELVGKSTNVSWGIIFPMIDDIPRHPSQLYEALLEGIILFALINLIYFKKNYKIGTCSYMFLIFYGILRIISESFREPDIQLGYLFGSISMGILLSSFMILIGAILYLKKNDS